MLKITLLALVLTASALTSGYFIGRDAGRAQLANECADTGLIALYDRDAEVHRRLHCFDIGSGEPAADSETPAEADGFRA